ncbi:Sucrose-phosphatase 2 [Symbiodinium microadriaticum]|uniref:Sucrose-phosphatase 2 n=1 Tax=Symbiodinium microadriaticum TaxID=2951 RepID=A0A1Q9CHX3_SYMMI|nr:Sucrose-phosphatase 2 [Symbiodinium microadriaticum]
MALRSVIGWLAWVAHATRPDLAYRFHALQQRVTTATVETLREVNRVVTLALNDAERRSQRGRIHYLTRIAQKLEKHPGQIWSMVFSRPNSEAQIPSWERWRGVGKRVTRARDPAAQVWLRSPRLQAVQVEEAHKRHFRSENDSKIHVVQVLQRLGRLPPKAVWTRQASSSFVAVEVRTWYPAPLRTKHTKQANPRSRSKYFAMPLTLYYYTGWDQCQLHGCPKGESTWRDFPFKDVPGKPSVKQLQIEADGIEFVICDLKKQSWDNPPDWYGKKNYLIAESGQYSLRHGHLRRIRESKVMVVTDLDHTLVGHERDPENKLLEEFRNLWLGEYALNGSALAYSTGRSKSMALDVAQERQLIRPDLLICGVGTEVYTVPSRLPILGWWEERDSLELMPEWKSKMLNGFNRATVEELLTSRFQKFELRGTPVDDPYRIPTAYRMDEAFDDSKKLLQEALGSSYQVISSGHGEWKLIDICSAEGKVLEPPKWQGRGKSKTWYFNTPPRD